MNEDPPEREFEVVVKLGFLVTIVALVLTYTALYMVAGALTARTAPFPEALNWSAGVVILILLGTVFHELGHVIAGLALGHRWTRVVLNGAGLGVGMSPAPTGWHRVLRSLAGPLVQIAIAIPLLAMVSLEPAEATAGTFQYSVWWAGGASNLVLAVINLLPFPRWDGGNALAGVREALSGVRP